jgi:hypothetical protein
MRKKKAFRFSGLFVFLLTIFLLTTSCGKEIRDFFKAIEKYGYKSKEPLSKKSVAVDKQLLGGYVYNSLPVIISEKDKFTYKLTFLSVELDLVNAEVEAFMSEINNSHYLNINMGDSYAFLKVSSVINNELPVKLLRNSLDSYVKPENLNAWLQKHGNEEEYTPENQSSIDIYYSFVFKKVTIDKAYQIQKELLHQKMVELFGSCKDYFTYDQLEKRYPDEPLLTIARENIFNNCKTIETYQGFITRFPNDILAEKAKEKIDEIKMFKADSVNFNAAIKQNSIDAYQSFLNNSSTSVFKDSANVIITSLANNITENDIEWRWTGSSKTDALKLLFQKIDYSDQPLNSIWYQQHLTFYCLKLQQPDITEKGLLYLDKLATKNPSKNEMLNLYLSKGFLLWSLEKIDLCIEVFHSKIEDSYTGDNAVSFRYKLKSWYKDLKGSDVVFPNEKATWKKIKKL